MPDVLPNKRVLSYQDQRALRRLAYTGAGSALVVAGGRGASGVLKLSARGKNVSQATRLKRYKRAGVLNEVSNIGGAVGTGASGVMALPLANTKEYRNAKKQAKIKKSHEAFLTEEQISKALFANYRKERKAARAHPYRPEARRIQRGKDRTVVLGAAAGGLGTYTAGRAAQTGFKMARSHKPNLIAAKKQFRSGYQQKARAEKLRNASYTGKGAAGRHASAMKASNWLRAESGKNRAAGRNTLRSGVYSRARGAKFIARTNAKTGIAALALGGAAASSAAYNRSRSNQPYHTRYSPKKS